MQKAFGICPTHTRSVLPACWKTCFCVDMPYVCMKEIMHVNMETPVISLLQNQRAWPALLNSSRPNQLHATGHHNPQPRHYPRKFRGGTVTAREAQCSQNCLWSPIHVNPLLPCWPNSDMCPHCRFKLVEQLAFQHPRMTNLTASIIY